MTSAHLAQDPGNKITLLRTPVSSKIDYEH